MVQTLASAHVDLVVLDIMLPGKDGLSLWREPRANGKLPIIMLTAIGGETDRVVGLEMGADDYLPKTGEMIGGGKTARAGPTISTRLPLAGLSIRNRQSCAAARSPRYRSTAWMLTAASSAARLHAPSHGVIADPADHCR